MKRFWVTLLTLMCIALLPFGVFADGYETYFSTKPMVSLEGMSGTELEIDQTYMLTVVVPDSSKDTSEVDINGKEYKGLHTYVVGVADANGNVDVARRVEETADGGVVFAITPRKEGTVQLQVTICTRGYDLETREYVLFEDENWSYTHAVKEYQVAPIEYASDYDETLSWDDDPIPSEEPSDETPSLDGTVTSSTAATDDQTPAKDTNGWLIWLFIGVGAVVVVLVAVLMSQKKKIVKRK